jgi:inorganic triphosphatase YgiF
MSSTEIELKLAVERKSLDRLRRLPTLKPLRDGRATSKTLWSTYYDTPDRRLALAGITVRVRRVDGGFVQTVKTAGDRASGLFSRREWEVPLTEAAPDAAALAATGVPLLADGGVVAGLAPIFTTDIHRTLYQLTGDGWRAEMALDVGELRAGERREEVCEVELELRDGAPVHLFAVARHIAEGVPVRPLTLSKSDRGHALAEGRRFGASKSAPLLLDAEMRVADAFHVIARNCLHHLLANQAPLLEQGDGEAVHQMRVALRRLRSALKIFRPLVEGPQLTLLRSEMNWLLAALGPARDAEVFLAEIIEPVLADRPDQEALIALRDHWRRRWADDLAAAHAAVAERRFALLLLDLGAWVEDGDWTRSPLAAKPLKPFAAKVLNKLMERMEKAGGKRLERLSPPALHRVRIIGKQVRYAGEFFASLYGKNGARDTLAVLGRLQDALGGLNDIAVAVPRLATCHHMGDAAWAAGMVAGWHEARRPDLLEDAAALWRDLRKRRRFWKG